MRNMMHLASGININPILLELKNNPHLWNENNIRTKHPTSPHHGLDDIFVRYSPPDLIPDDVYDHMEKIKAPHEYVWYDSANYLPSVKAMAYEVMHMVKGERLGGILITRIPAGKECTPHADVGSWQAEYFDKYALQIESSPEQAFCFDGESFSANPGDLYWFYNQNEHWVTNASNYDRITVIFCIRTNKKDKFNTF